MILCDLVKFNKSILLDEEDLLNFGFKSARITTSGYLAIYINKKWKAIHLLLITASIKVDHVNQNKLDNRKINLRSASNSQNAVNSKLYSNNSSGYRNVVLENKTGKFRARISIKGKQVHIGTFETAELAAAAYDRLARIHYKEFAVLNFD